MSTSNSKHRRRSSASRASLRWTGRGVEDPAHAPATSCSVHRPSASQAAHGQSASGRPWRDARCASSLVSSTAATRRVARRRRGHSSSGPAGPRAKHTTSCCVAARSEPVEAVPLAVDRSAASSGPHTWSTSSCSSGERVSPRWSATTCAHGWQARRSRTQGRVARVDCVADRGRGPTQRFAHMAPKQPRVQQCPGGCPRASGMHGRGAAGHNHRNPGVCWAGMPTARRVGVCE